MFAVPAAMAASFLAGCTTPLSITDRTDPNRSSIVQVQEGYDTLGRKWEVLDRHESILLSYTGTITELDYANREMTLKGADGRVESFYVAKSVQRFNEAKVGDKVSIDYYLGVSAVVRPPTEAEKQNPLVVVDAMAKTGPQGAPAAYDVRQIRAVVTIESMDRQAQTITVKGPRGNCFTARVKDPSRLDKVRVGQTILMTFTEATAASLKPAAD
jgi:hypothetical protein